MDTPLTEIGRLQSSLIGSGLESEKLLGDGFEVFVSPSLRCIETATNILKGKLRKKKYRHFSGTAA